MAPMKAMKAPLKAPKKTPMKAPMKAMKARSPKANEAKLKEEEKKEAELEAEANEDKYKTESQKKAKQKAARRQKYLQKYLGDATLRAIAPNQEEKDKQLSQDYEDALLDVTVGYWLHEKGAVPPLVVDDLADMLGVVMEWAQTSRGDNWFHGYAP